MEKDYLNAGRASDLKGSKDRALFRLFEILPGAISFGTIFLVILLSWLKPVWMAFFIIFFVIYWLFRTVYFSFHLQATYKKMKKYEKIDWIEKLNKLPITKYQLPINGWKEIYQLVIFPIYKEPLEIARDSFNALLKSDYPKDKLIVVFSSEERAREHGQMVAKEIEKEFGNKFFKLLITEHPKNLPGEIAGHGSNDAWAAGKVKESIIDQLQIPYENIIVSSFDIDTYVFSKYFSCLTYHYLTSKNPTHTSFQPVSLFINNIWQAPIFARVFSFSSTFWQMMCQERPEKLITFSSHSMSFKALVEVGFKQTNVVSDDSRIFWQCFLHFKGDYRVQPIYYPVSLDANVAKTFWRTLINIYKQQRRWAYGAGEIPYMMFGFLKDKEITLSKKISLGFTLWECHWSWATNSIIIFLLGWLPLVLGGREFGQSLISYNLPKITSQLLTLAMVGLVGSAYISLRLLPPKPLQYGRFKYFVLVAEWFLLPLIMIFFTSLPALEAQARWLLGKYMGFWPTEKIRK
jgi:cellulose synthase/poly-beta-1,6-N-acetylglucosamine synthase-like glycosyltransferase